MCFYLIWSCLNFILVLSILLVVDISLNSVNQFRDLCIILSANLSFNAHISSIYGKSLRVLGFIKRTCFILYESIVLHASKIITWIWCGIIESHQPGSINKLERSNNFFYVSKPIKLYILIIILMGLLTLFNSISLKTRLYTNSGVLPTNNV